MFSFRFDFWPPSIYRLKYLEVEFLGWKDEEVAKKYLQYVSYFETESCARRASPAILDYGIHRIDVIDEKEGGTPIGTMLHAYYDHKRTSPEKVYSFFTDSPLLVKLVDKTTKVK